MGTVVMRARSTRALACLSLLAFSTALSSVARAIPVRDPVCSAWGAIPDTTPFLEEVPREGYVLLPFELVPGFTPIDYSETVAISAELRDPEGTSWPGYMAYSGVTIPAYPLGPALLWKSSREFVAGGRYQLLVSVQNPANCPIDRDPIQATYDVLVSEKTLPERVDAAAAGATARLEWTRSEFPPQCCVARNTEHCADPAQCFACAKSSVRENVVLTRAPSAESAYLTYHAFVRGSDDVVLGSYPFSAADAEVRVPVPLCRDEYCAELSVISPLTEYTVAGEPICISGSTPQIEPAADGSEIVAGDPCADGSGPGSFRFSGPPQCNHYPEVRWFSSEVDGLVALGVSQSAAEAQARNDGVGAFGGMGGSAGTGGAPAAMGSMSNTGDHVSNRGPDDPNCAITAPHPVRRDGSALALLFGLLAVRRRSRRT